MEKAEALLREIQLALKHCDLDYEEILEDYREHLRELRERSNEKFSDHLHPKQTKDKTTVRQSMLR